MEPGKYFNKINVFKKNTYFFLKKMLNSLNSESAFPIIHIKLFMTANIL